MAQALFVDEVYLKNYTPISSNVDIDFIFPHILVFQDLNIQPMLGKKLYQGLQTRIIASTLSADDIDLLDLCRQALIWGTVEQMIPFLAIQIRNKSVGSNNGENFESADLDKLKWLQAQAAGIYANYAQRIQDYLCLNGSLFTEYTHPDQLGWPDNQTSYDSDLYLGNSNDNEDMNTLRFWRKYINP